jgi:DNA repair exonuclease SbcCD ATPase subunit
MIVFKYVRWRNFLSTGNNWTELQLNRHSDTLVIGNNGAGKSTMLDALCFVLFGKPFRKVNKPQLINSINQSKCEVEVEFSIGSKEYKIIRGIKPNLFEIYCDNVLLNQDSKSKDYQEYLERVILKLNFKSFTQVVILGSASFVPFMQLPAADRRAIIEDLLDIRIFSSMNLLVKDKMAALKEQTRSVKYEMELTTTKIQLQKNNIEENKAHNEEEIKNKKSEIESSQLQSSKLQKDIELIQKHINSLSSKIDDESKVRAKSKKILQMESKLESTLTKIEKDIIFFSQNDHCPTCTQTINEQIKNDKITEKSLKKSELQDGLSQLSEELQKTNNRITAIVEINKNIVKHMNAVTEHNATIRAINEYISKQQKEIERLLDRKENIIGDNSQLKELKEQLAELIKKQEELSIEKHYYDYAAGLLKDTGIKTRIIKQYLPIMNKLINKYLSAMDFFVNFNINENFEETIKSRHRDDFSYDSFSEGQKMRIDLALLFAWRQIAKMKNSTNTNLLILDEVFDSSLDAVGTEEFLKLIHDMGNDTNIFVISHKGDQLFDKFRSVIKFELKGNFSRMVK